MANTGNEECGTGEKVMIEPIRRRSVLSTLGVVGLAAASGRVGAVQEGESEEESEDDSEDGSAEDGDEEPQWPEPDDEYYQTLVDDLSEMGLPPAEFVHGDSEAAVFSQYWAGTGDEESYGTVENIDVSGDDVPFSKASRFTVEEVPPNEYDVQLRTADWHSEPYRSVESGDVMLAVVYLRAPEGTGQIQFAADNSRSTQWNSVTGDARQGADEEWTRYYFPIEFVADADGSEFQWSTQFHFGSQEQTIDIGGIALLDFDKRVSTVELPEGSTSSGNEDDTDENGGEDTEQEDTDDETGSGDDSDDENGGDEDTDDEDETGSSDTEQSETTDAGSSQSQESDGGLTDSVPGLGIVTGLAGLGAAAGRLVSKASSGRDRGGNGDA